MDEKTQVEDSEKKTKDEDSYEKRYKDSQTHITKIEQENASLRDTANKDKELLDAVSPYVNWDAANGKQTMEVDDDGYVDKKTLNDKLGTIQKQIVENQQLQYFRTKYPELIEQEIVVSAFFNKTDPRKKFEDRLNSAVENTQKLIESQRTKGREEYEKEKKEKTAKEAAVAGLAGGKGPKGSKEEPEGESYEDYIKSRKSTASKARGE